MQNMRRPPRFEPPRFRRPSIPPAWPNPPVGKNGIFGVSAGGFTFRFTVGTAARQIFLDGHSYKCRKIVIVAPDADFAQANNQSIFYALGPSATALDGSSELPPGTSETISIDDVNKLWFIAQNGSDLVFGRVES